MPSRLGCPHRAPRSGAVRGLPAGLTRVGGVKSIVPLSRSPYRAPGTGEQARGHGRAARPHAERSRRQAPNGGTDQRSGPLTVSAPGPGCVAWAYDDGDEQTRWLVRPAGNARREAQRVAGPEARRDEVPGWPRHAGMSDAIRRCADQRPAFNEGRQAWWPPPAAVERQPTDGSGTIEPEGRRHAQRGSVHEERGPGLAGETPR